MASRGSHRACRRCHTGRVDKRAGLEMCRPCREIVARQQRQQRAAVKQRRIARSAVSEDKQLAEPDLSPEVVAAQINVGTIPEPPKHRGGAHPKVLLSDEQRAEIVRLYLDTEESVPEIARAFGINPSYPYYILQKQGISWRRGDTAPKPVLDQGSTNGHVTPEVVDDIPQDVVKALENMIRLPVEPPRPEPVRAMAVPTPTVPAAPSLPEYVEQVLPTPQGGHSTVGDEQTWRVDYEGSILVQASSIEQALERARADGHIRKIVGVTLRTR